MGLLGLGIGLDLFEKSTEDEVKERMREKYVH